MVRWSVCVTWYDFTAVLAGVVTFCEAFSLFTSTLAKSKCLKDVKQIYNAHTITGEVDIRSHEVYSAWQTTHVPEYFGPEGFISGFRDRLGIFIWDFKVETSFCHITLICTTSQNLHSHITYELFKLQKLYYTHDVNGRKCFRNYC